MRLALLASFALALGAGCGAGAALGTVASPDPVDGWVRRAESLRGLAFLRPVAVRVVTRSEASARVGAEIRALLTSAEIEARRDAYAALGVLPPDTDLLAIFTAIYEEQMLGRYSPRDRALYMLDRTTPGDHARETVAVHELVHALQHQHAPRTLELVEGLRHNDDVASTLSGALEGDASFTMLGADDGDADTERDLASARRFRDLMLVDLAAPSGALLHAPLAVRLAVVVPYAHGVMLAARRHAAGGNAALDALIQDAPLSTSELLSEGLESAPETAFVRLPLAELARSAPAGCALGHHNVAGGLSLLALFEERGLPREQAEQIARDWQGDRFVRVDCAGGAELLWLTVWRSEAAAARFEGAYRSIAGVLARGAPLAGEPAPRRAGSRVLVVTPGLAGVAALALESAELRSYAGLSGWIADGCFGEDGGCPRADAAGGQARKLAFPLQIQGALGSSDELDR